MKTRLRYATRRDIGKRVIILDNFHNGATGFLSQYFPGAPFPWVVTMGRAELIFTREEFRVVEHETIVDKEYEDMLV